MVIIFMNENARNQLLNNGIVYTLRHLRKSIGLDWMTDKRGGKKICDIRITFIKYGKYSELKDVVSLYVDDSGFNSVDDWINEYKRYRSSKFPTFWLYRVDKVIK